MIIDFLSFPIINPLEREIDQVTFKTLQTYSSNYINLPNNVNYSLLCLKNENILHEKSFKEFSKKVSKRIGFVFLIDPKNPNIDLLINKINSLSIIKGIAFHPYLQNLKDINLSIYKKIFSKLNKNLFVGVFTAYGSKKIFDISPLNFAVKLLKVSNGRNFIFYHAGGMKILEAFLIAEMWENVYLETSFSLSYWKDSSVQNDINFVIKKLGSDRILFGSDHPFIDIDKSIIDHNKFFKKYKISKINKENIYFKNAKKILGL